MYSFNMLMGATLQTSSEIRWWPKNTFPILLFDVGPLKPKQSTGNAFKAIDQRRDGMFGWIVHKQVNLVYLAMHLCQQAFKISTDLVEDGFEPIKGIGVKDLFPVPSQEDQMDMKLRVCDVKTNVQISSVSELPATRKIAGNARRVSRAVQRGLARAS
jgi:hypothetical protein